MFENQIQQTLLAKQKTSTKTHPFLEQILSPTPRISLKTKTNHTDLSEQMLQTCIVQQQHMREFFTFAKGGEQISEFSCKMSLSNHRNSIQKFYILKNPEQQIRRSIQYKKISIEQQKISIENFKNYLSGQIRSFVYLNENHQKLNCNKDSSLMKGIVPQAEFLSFGTEHIKLIKQIPPADAACVP